MMIRTTSLLVLLATCVSATIKSATAIVEADDVSGFKLESPWAVAVADNGKVWFSNFGAPFGSVDWVGSVSSGSAKEEYGINDVSDLQIMHVKALAAGEGDDLYLAAYGGPTASAIVKCSGTCRVLATISTGNYLPTAVAFSSTMKRVFYALADGALEKSRIYSVAVDGDIDRVLYVEQDDDVGVAFPVGLAVDDVNQHLYWSNDAGPDQIQRGPLAKEYSASGADKIGTVLSGKTTSARPHSLALDVVGRKIYFTDQTSATHQIGRVDYDGENLETLKELGNNTPHGLALNVADQLVYWAETGESKIYSGEVSDLGEAPPKTTSVARAVLSMMAMALAMLAAL